MESTTNAFQAEYMVAPLGVAALLRLILSERIAQRPTNLGGSCLAILAKLNYTLTKRSFTVVTSNTSSIV